MNTGRVVQGLRESRGWALAEALKKLSKPYPLQKVEQGQSLPSVDMINDLIRGWNLSLEEGTSLRESVHQARLLRDGFDPTPHGSLGEDIETRIAVTVGDVLTEMTSAMEPYIEYVKHRRQFLLKLSEVLDKHIRANFR